MSRDLVKEYLEENGFFDGLSEEQKEKMVKYHNDAIASKGYTSVFCDGELVANEVETSSIVHDICFATCHLYTTDKIKKSLEVGKTYTIITKQKNWTTIVENVKFMHCEECEGGLSMFSNYRYTFRNNYEIGDDNGRQY